MARSVDVAVIGGGPGGAVAAAGLAQRGVHVELFERELDPCFRLGESLLPWSMAVFTELGLADRLDGAFVRKYGARFHDDRSGRSDRFTFDGGIRGDWPYAYQARRAVLDELLRCRAEELGCAVHRGAEVTRVEERTGGGGFTLTTAGAGATDTITARVVVDATGRSALLGRQSGAVARYADLNGTAIFTHVTGLEAREGDALGDIDVVFSDRAWTWIIPFGDGTGSVGTVLSPTRLADMRRAHGGTLDAVARDLLDSSPAARARLRGTSALWPAKVVADFSYSVAPCHGARWIAVGDASGFIDPLFSSGVHLAVVGAFDAARTIADALDSGAPLEDALASCARRRERAASYFLSAVRAFYGKGLTDLIFADDRRAIVRRSLTSLLAGDVHDESARWLPPMQRFLDEPQSTALRNAPSPS